MSAMGILESIIFKETAAVTESHITKDVRCALVFSILIVIRRCFEMRSNIVIFYFFVCLCVASGFGRCDVVYCYRHRFTLEIQTSNRQIRQKYAQVLCNSWRSNKNQLLRRIFSILAISLIRVFRINSKYFVVVRVNGRITRNKEIMQRK